MIQYTLAVLRVVLGLSSPYSIENKSVRDLILAERNWATDCLCGQVYLSDKDGIPLFHQGEINPGEIWGWCLTPGIWTPVLVQEVLGDTVMVIPCVNRRFAEQYPGTVLALQGGEFLDRIYSDLLGGILIGIKPIALKMKSRGSFIADLGSGIFEELPVVTALHPVADGYREAHKKVWAPYHNR